MKNFKFQSFFIGTFLISAFLINSCKDACKDVSCLNGGICIDGICDCLEGYSGTNCEIEDPCLNVTCLNGGTCDSGVCDCPDGYEGTDCGTVTRDKFLGSWDGSESCTISGNTDYTIVITTSSKAVDKITIDNFGAYGLGTSKVVATVDGVDITIASQVVQGATFAGTGSIDAAGTTISLTYTTDDGTQTETCTGSFAKQ